MPIFLEERNIRLLKLLPALCILTMRIHKGMRNIKPTITESLNSFILSVNVSIIYIYIYFLCVNQFYVCENIIAVSIYNTYFFLSQSPADLEDNIERQRTRAAVLNLTLQPFIIFVGLDASSINAYYVCIDKTLYKIESALKAIDICYKCFFVLHACYPKECQQIWLLIQKCLYEMTTK